MNNPFSRSAPREVRGSAFSIFWTALAILVILLVIFAPKVLAWMILSIIVIIVGTIVVNSAYRVIRYMIYGSKE